MRHKSLGIKVAERIVSQLSEIRRTSTMETADFSEEIKQKTRLWRNSWIISPLDNVIETIKKECGFNSSKERHKGKNNENIYNIT